MFTATGKSRFHHRSFPSAALAVLFAALALLAITMPVAGQTSERCFLETGFCIAGPIRTFWERNGGLPAFGLPITPQQEEQIEDRTLQVQWFERNRLEIQPHGAITLGR